MLIDVERCRREPDNAPTFPNNPEGHDMGRIIVGVDGSEHSLEALRWAVREATLRNATVQVISAWTYPVMPADGLAGGAYVRGLDPETLEAAARSNLETAVNAACPDEASRSRLELLVVEGSAGRALVEASKGADLLVVGSRGHGGFANLLLGSVSSQCVHHAHCPVTVIRTAD